MDSACRSLLSTLATLGAEGAGSAGPEAAAEAVSALSGMLEEAAAGATCMLPDAPGGPAVGAEAVATLCRSLVAVGHAFPGSVSGAIAGAVARAMVTHAASPAAMEQACVLVGDALGRGVEAARFVEAGGAPALVCVLKAQIETACAAATMPEAMAAAKAAATQALVAMCSIAGNARGGAALVTGGAIAAVVSALGSLADGDVAVAEAGCLAIHLMLHHGPASAGTTGESARHILMACGGVEALVRHIRSP